MIALYKTKFMVTKRNIEKVSKKFRIKLNFVVMFKKSKKLISVVYYFF